MLDLIASAVQRQAQAEPGPVDAAPTLPEVGVLRVASQPFGGVYTYPPDHIPALVVPKGGSSCANCKFAVPDAPGGPTCTSPDFIAAELPGKPAGNGLLPLPPDEYASDWWRPAL